MHYIISQHLLVLGYTFFELLMMLISVDVTVSVCLLEILQFRHPVAVSKMLVNEHISSSLYDGLRRSLRQGSKEFANLQGAKQLSYARKEQVSYTSLSCQ